MDSEYGWMVKILASAANKWMKNSGLSQRMCSKLSRIYNNTMRSSWNKSDRFAENDHNITKYQENTSNESSCWSVSLHPVGKAQG